METDTLRVLIVANDPLARAGLATLLTGQPGCIVVGQIATGTDLAAEVEVYRPDVLLWDLGWEPASSPDHLEALEEVQLPRVALLPDETNAAELWAGGLTGLLFRDANADRLIVALLAVRHGLAALEPELVPALRPNRAPATEPLLEELTPREVEVLRLMAEGLPNKAIARRLDISEHTVKFHVNAILSKLAAQSRTEAVVRATRLGLLLL
jgi:DNA-binding NarL/FixJ family response regulator